MSGAGSPRYMAPELLWHEEYNLKSDVYSFSIILWQMLAGETPYGFVRSRQELFDHVADEHGRPDIDERWPTGIKSMLECSFDKNMDLRPVSATDLPKLTLFPVILLTLDAYSFIALFKKMALFHDNCQFLSK